MTETGATLVFPGGMPAALRYAAEARCRGERVVGASSLPFDPDAAHYAVWETLPWLDDGDFEARLVALVGKRGITRIHTSHIVIYERLQRRLPHLLPACELVGEVPYAVELRGYRQRFATAAAHAAAPAIGIGAAEPRMPRLEEDEWAALLRVADAVPGMCNDEKLWAVAETLRYAPAGDLVEIGSWWGKSATALAWLAARNGVGSLLCVDPWSAAEMRQGIPELDAIGDRQDFEEAFRVFRINMLSLGARNVNVLRLPSAEASARYRGGREVETPWFGRTRYAGRIAVLHIDGNHERAAVEQDIAGWADLLAPGGWIIFDDYCWPFGTGPQEAADAWLDANARRIDAAFHAGSALFARLAPPRG